MSGYRRIQMGTMVGALAIGMLAGGCGSSLATSDSTGSLLDLLANLGISEDTTLGDLLDQVTVGQVLDGVTQFAGSPAIMPGPFTQSGLSDAELVEIESLQAQLEAGEITEQEYNDALREIVGYACGMPPGGPAFGGGPSRHGMGRGAPPPALTDEQQQAADEIFQAERDDLEALRAAAEEDIRALLTEEQAASFDGLPPLPIGGGPPPPVGPGGIAHGHEGGPLDRLTQALGLSDEQQIAIEEILTELHDAVAARHEQTRDELLSLLTDEQLEQLGQTAEAAQEQ